MDHGNNPFVQTMMQMQNKGPQQQGGSNPMAQMSVQQPAGSPPQAGGSSPDISAILAGMQGGGAGAMGGGGASKLPGPSNMPGQNPGSTQSLAKVLVTLNQVITDTDDPQEIQLIRQIIMQIQHLIQMDQQKQGGKESGLGQAQSQIPAAIQAQQ